MKANKKIRRSEPPDRADSQERLVQVLLYTCRGRSTLQIARLMRVSPRTIEQYRVEILHRLEAKRYETLSSMLLRHLSNRYDDRLLRWLLRNVI